MIICSWDESGELLWNVLYELDVLFPNSMLNSVFETVAPLEDRTGWIVVPIAPEFDEKAAHAETLPKVESVPTCSLNEEHRYTFRYYNWKADLFGSDVLAPLVSDQNGSILVNHDTTERLRESALEGIAADLVPIACNQSDLLNPRIYRLYSTGQAEYQGYRIVSPEPNTCQFCGLGYVVCPDCGKTNHTCEECGKEIIVSEDKHHGPSDLRHIRQICSGKGSIIEGHTWDGCDMIGEGLFSPVTGRFLEWLIETGVTGFAAKPIRVCLDHCTPEQRRMILERKSTDIVEAFRDD